MTDERQRDRAIERMLRHGGTAPSLDASSACIDGETLAAWSSGALDARAASQVEEHLADCARCQSMLAAFVRTEPVTAAPAPWWRRTEVRWLVPLATAATVAAIWVVTPQRDEPAATPSAESRDRPASQGFANPAETKPGAEQGTAPNAVAPSPSRAQPATPTPRPPSVGVQTPPVSAQAVAPAREADIARERKEEPRARTAPELEARVETGNRAASQPAAAAAPAAPAARAESVAADTLAALKLAQAPGGEIMAPGGTIRWRIVEGRVLQSAALGENWQPITLPAAATITAGHAPSASVLWLVGKAGAIFVTTDAARFERVPFTSSVDLVSVVAVDERQATVTTADGGRFRTTDRGQRWTALQP